MSRFWNGGSPVNTLLDGRLIRHVFDRMSGSDQRFVYDVSDTEPDTRNYKAVLITHTHLNWQYSSLYYSKWPHLAIVTMSKHPD